MPGVKPLAFALQFRGVASFEDRGVLVARATAPSGAIRTIVEADGVRAGYEPAPGDEAVMHARIVVADDASFSVAGSITFGVSHVVRYRTLAGACLDATPDRHLRQGSAIFAIEGGSGQFEAARGHIASSFLLSDTGELTDHQVGLVFVRTDGDGRGSRERH